MISTKSLMAFSRELGSKEVVLIRVLLSRDSGELLIVVTHVDDFLLVGEADRIDKLFLSKLSHYMKFTGGGTCNDHLGISFTYETYGFYLNQSNKIDLYCKEIQVTKPMSSLSSDFNGFKSGVEVLETRDLYLKAIGYLNYLSLFSRPDIMCVASILSSYSEKPTKLAWRAVVKVFAYLLGIKSRSLFHRLNDGSEILFNYCAYVDASFKSLQEKELKSRSRYIAFLDRNPLFWFSKRQPLTSQSTEEAEVIAANEGVRALCGLRNIMIESGLLSAKP